MPQRDTINNQLQYQVKWKSKQYWSDRHFRDFAPI